MSQQSMFEQGHPGSRMRPAGESTRNASFAEVRKREPGRQESRMKGSGLPTKVDELGDSQREVYDGLAQQDGPVTDQELRDWFVEQEIHMIMQATDLPVREVVRRAERMWPISKITGRRNDLVKHGLVTKAGERACRITDNNVSIWEVIN